MNETQLEECAHPVLMAHLGML